MSRKKTNRVGERRVSKQGLVMEITRYYNNKDMTVTFLQTGETVRTRYDRFKKGDVKATKFPIKKGHITAFALATILAFVGIIAVLAWLVKIIFF